MRKVLVLNGPNLNLLGTREPEVYGSATLAEVEKLCTDEARRRGIDVECRQSNHEGQLIDWIHGAGREHAAGTLIGVVLNAGAYTHTSIGLRDAIAATGVPVVELHISNTHAREPFRHHSYLSAVALGVIQGFGIHGYALAIDALLRTGGGGASAGQGSAAPGAR
ncbi:MAG: type II 3-dehydroquinate dehydratase [Casimicrobiaceae bacterium]